MSSVRAHKINGKWRSEDVKLDEDRDFPSLNLSRRVLKGLKRSGFRKLAPIQLAAIPLGRFGADLMIQSKSGTGKTCVFSVVALENLLHYRTLQVLVLTPTGEIAHQICEVIKSIGQAIPYLQCHMFIGGSSVKDDVAKLRNCQIAVGTPGRIQHLIRINALNTAYMYLLVFDEADKLVSQPFVNDINWIFNRLPLHKQVLSVSATFPEPVKKLLENYMRYPLLISVNENQLAPRGITQYYCVLDHHPLNVGFQTKIYALLKIMSRAMFSQCLIFCNCIKSVELLHDFMLEEGWPVEKFVGKDHQTTRLDTLEQFKQFKCLVLVSSDLTARGIDVIGVDLVINFDLPMDLETYVHRIGRAGRYGSKAISITFISTGYDEQKLSEYEHTGNFKLYPLPDPLPRDLFHWSPKKVAASKAKKCMQSIDELKSKSFTGSYWAENKDLSEETSEDDSKDSDDLSAEKSVDVCSPGGNKSKEGNGSIIPGKNAKVVSSQLHSETLLENSHLVSGRNISTKNFKDLNLSAEDCMCKVADSSMTNDSLSKRTNVQKYEVLKHRSKAKAVNNSSLSSLATLVQKPNVKQCVKADMLGLSNKSSSIQDLPLDKSCLKPKVKHHKRSNEHEQSSDSDRSGKCAKPRQPRHPETRRHSTNHNAVSRGSTAKEHRDPLPSDLSTWSRKKVAASRKVATSKVKKYMRITDEQQLKMYATCCKSFTGIVEFENEDPNEETSEDDSKDTDDLPAERSDDLCSPGGNKSKERIGNSIPGGNPKVVSSQLHSETLLENNHLVSGRSDQITGEGLNNSKSEEVIVGNTFPQHNSSSDDAHCLVDSKISCVEDKSVSVELNVDCSLATRAETQC